MNFLRNLIQGGVPAPGSADPPCKLEEEADIQRVTTEPVSEIVNGASPPSSPRSPLSDSSPQRLIKDCETPSTTEETSFASCLTEEANSLSETIPISTGNAVINTRGVKNDSSLNSVSDSVAQNGVKKDSEYESAEEVDLPPDPVSVVTQQPSSNKSLPAAPVLDEVCSLDQIVISCDEPVIENCIKENGIHELVNGVEAERVADEKYLPNSGDLESAISESLVTVTKNEIIEESISQKTFVQQEITQIVPNHTVLNGEVDTNCIEEENCGNSADIVDKTEDLSENCIDTDKVFTHQSEKDENILVNHSTTEEEVNNCENLDKVVPSSDQPNHKDSAIPPNTSPESIQEETLPKPVIQEEKPSKTEEDTKANTCTDQVGEEAQSEKSFETRDVERIQTPEVSQEVNPISNEAPVGEEDLPLPPSKGYDLDFLDNLDDPNFNPFASKTAVRNTPPPSPEPGRKLPPLKPAVKKKKDTKSVSKEADSSDNKSESQAPVEAISTKDKEVELPVTETTPSGDSKPDQLLEVTLEDSSKPIKPPPRLTRKSVPSKKPVTKVSPKPKVVEKNNNRVDENPLNESENKTEESEDLPIPPSKGYNLDFLDNLDDPNFNPFATKTEVRSSPPKDGFTLPNDQEIKPKAKVVPAKKTSVKKGFAVTKNKAKPTPAKEEENANPPEEEDLPVPPKKGYNLAFLDDPDFDPFKSNNNDNSDVFVKAPEPDTQVLGSPCTDEPEDSCEVLKNTPVSEDLPTTELSKNTPVSEDLPTTELLKNTPVSEDLPTSEVLKNTLVSEDLPSPTEDITCDQIKETSVEKEETESTSTVHHIDSVGSDVVDSPKESDDQEKVDINLNRSTDKSEKCDVDVSKVEQSETRSDSVLDSKSVENNNSVSESEQPKVDSQQEVSHPSEASYERNFSLPKVPSIGTIGHLDSLEFAQLLGNEASRLAEEFMNCSTDSGLPDSDDSVQLKSSNTNAGMAHVDENVNPFQRKSKLQRSPPLGKRDQCGADGGAATDPIDSFKPRRMLLRESVPGEERLDTSSLDDDSGIALGTRSDLETDVNHSEAGPEIATGLTSSDLQCASQLKNEDQDDELFDQITDEEFLASEAFFKEATDMENQLRKGLATPPFRGSQSKLSGDEVTPTKDKPTLRSSTPEPQNKSVPSTSTPVPPHEERSAPEGTSSPTPRPSDTSERKSSSSRPNSIPSEGYMTATEVQKLLKQQELQFEEKLLRAELASGEKEKKLRQAMKDEQKELSNLGESVSELTASRDALLKLVGQYKGMLASLVSEKEKEKQNQEERIKTLEQERNQAFEDLANVEVAFSDVHRKYERTKQVVDTLKRNEETLRGAVSDYEKKLQKQEQKFIEFQKHAEEKIQLANEEFEAMRRGNEQEMTKMAALLKKAEMKIMSLQDSNDRKTRENQELTQLCDDLINKVGSSH